VYAVQLAGWMTECGLTDVVKRRTELGADVFAVSKFLSLHQKLLHDIEVCRVFSSLSFLGLI